MKCAIQSKVSGKRRRGRPKTPYSVIITKWMSESMERIRLRLRNIYLAFESNSTATVISKQIIERNMSGDSH